MRSLHCSEQATSHFSVPGRLSDHARPGIYHNQFLFGFLTVPEVFAKLVGNTVQRMGHPAFIVALIFRVCLIPSLTALAIDNEVKVANLL
ncbi:hypothetical protein P8C59_006328 [Phyllachora maydis]|uniref:Uncharacterized protein n=1 Tax=Phyllachora maydis TaxID=1825666 RepID=A0AAD9I7G9_9PEZI|nr:hypothetical protein P8C59_006328 [Phyllachora maydis]